jgi:hypothetical protein
MLKHRGFPGRLPGTDFQFTIRRAARDGASRLIRRERYRDRAHPDRMADEAFLAALWAHFGAEPFVRGNLDAGRLSWLFGREVVPAEEPFDPASYEARLRIDVRRAQAAFPEVFAPGAAAAGWSAPGPEGGGDDGWDDGSDADAAAPARPPLPRRGSPKRRPG